VRRLRQFPRTVAVLGGLWLSTLGYAERAWSQGPPGGGVPPQGQYQQRGGQSAGPRGGRGPQGQQGRADEAAEPQGPVKGEVPASTEPLARYIQAEPFWLYVEFPGLNAFPDVWRTTAAYGMLNETSLGAMLRQVIADAVEDAPAPEGREEKPLSGEETAAIVEHILQHGFVAASPGNFEELGANHLTVVLRNAAHPNVRALFGKFIGAIASPGTQPNVIEAKGRQIVEMNKTPDPTGLIPSSWAWWIEGNDLVFVFVNPRNGIETVTATLDGAIANALDQPIRSELLAPEGAFQPAAVAVAQFDRPGAGVGDRQMVEETGLRRLDLRWGFERDALKTVIRLDAPQPRKGALSLVDQPTFRIEELPPMPPEVESFLALSIDGAGLLGQIEALLDEFQDGMGAQLIGEAKAAVKKRTGLDLEDEMLARIGPRMTFYTLPRAEAQGRGSNPIAGMMANLGIQNFGATIEVKNAETFASVLGALVNTANQQFEALMPRLRPEAPADEEPPARAGGRPGGSYGGAPPGAARRGRNRNQDEDAEPEVPKFKLMVMNPRTYMLELPQGIVALTGLRPTMTLGSNHLIIASNPALARQIREMEGDPDAPRWEPRGAVADRLADLPGGLTMLSLQDTSRELPETLASLPQTIETLVTGAGGQAQAASGRGPGMAAGSGSGRGAEFPGASSLGASGPGASSIGASGGAPPGGSGSRGRGSGGGRPGSRGNANPAAPPSPEQLRAFLFPSTYALAVDETTIRFEAREAFPNLIGLSTLGGGLPPGGLLGGPPAGMRQRGGGQSGGGGAIDGAGDTVN